MEKTIKQTQSQESTLIKELATPISIVTAGFLIALAILFQGDISLNFDALKKAKTTATDTAGVKKLTQGDNVLGAQDAGAKVKVSVDNDPSIGDDKAKVTVIEFSDFQCPFCKRLYDTVYSKLKREYIDTGKVRLVFRDYPLSFHPNAEIGAEAGECAHEQGKFWELHDRLFTKQDEWSSLSNDDAKAKFISYASDLGLNSQTFASCLNLSKYKDEISKDSSDGSTAGVSGTPTLFINGTKIVGAQPYDSFKVAIDKELGVK